MQDKTEILEWKKPGLDIWVRGKHKPYIMMDMKYGTVAVIHGRNRSRNHKAFFEREQRIRGIAV